MNGNPVTWFEIYVKDMERAKAFYEGAFGWRVVGQYPGKTKFPALGDCRRRRPQTRVRERGLPFAKKQIVQFVGADDMPDRPERTNLVLNRGRPLDRRP